jgi:NAD(P)-dependent dehydrogenase (short-subunit alcohol dehydrogenase family)
VTFRGGPRGARQARTFVVSAGISQWLGLKTPRAKSRTPARRAYSPVTGRLASKVVIVTGGSTGIGRAVASRVVSDGAAAVIGGLTRSAALEGAGRGPRVNALVTGNFDTPLYRDLLGAPAEGELPGPAPNPTGRVASPAEIASFIAFLLSDESAFITGAALAIDGGSTAQ